MHYWTFMNSTDLCLVFQMYPLFARNHFHNKWSHVLIWSLYCSFAVLQLKTSLRRTIQLYTESEMESASGTDTVRRRRGSSTHSKNSSNLSDSGSLPPKASPKPKWVTKLIPEENTETDNVSKNQLLIFFSSILIFLFWKLQEVELWILNFIKFTKNSAEQIKF